MFCDAPACLSEKAALAKIRKNSVPRPAYLSRTPMNCASCGVSFFPESTYAASARKRNSQIFCESLACQQARKEFITANNMALMHKHLQSGGLERMLHNNPMKDDTIKNKTRMRLLEIGHKPLVRGGNGHGLTVPQALLLSFLGDGWVAEFSVLTGCKKGQGYPTCLKIDIANKEKMIAIEVDGASHNNAIARERDARKNFLLGRLGWSVLRFKNREVLLRAELIAKEVNSLTFST